MIERLKRACTRFVDSHVFTASSQAAARQQAIADFGLVALECEEMKDIIRESRKIILRVTDCDEAGVFEYEALRRAFVPVDGVTWLGPDGVVFENDDLAQAVIRNAGPFVYDDAITERRADMTRLAAAGFRSGIVALIGPRGKPMGVITAHSRSAHRFGRRDATLVTLIANITTGVAARIFAEADLRNAEAVVRSAHDGIVTLDGDGIITFANASAARMAGCSPHDLIGLNAVDLAVAEDRPAARALFRATLNGETVKKDLRLRTTHDVLIWVAVTTGPLTDACGRSIGAMAVISDITDRVLATETLGLQKRQLDDAQAVAHVGSWEIDLDQRTVMLSEEIFHIAGLAPHASPASLDALAPLLPPDAPLESEALLEKLASTPEFDLTYEVLRPDGERRWVRSRGRREFHRLTGTRRLFGTTQDITTEKLAERAREEMAIRLRSAANEWRETFDSIPSPLLIVDENLRVQRLNAAALKLSRVGSFADALMLRIEELGDTAVWAELAAIVERRIDEGSFTTRIEDADGKQWNVVASRWNTGADRRATIFTADVTEIARLEAAARRNERMSAVGALVAGVAHEVQNPLFGISAALDALEATGNGSMLARVMSNLRQQVGRLNELMHDLLEYGKPATPVLRMDSVSVLLTEAVESTAPFAEKAGVTIVVEVADGIPRISMDRHRMLQVIENLIKNAIQHSLRTGVVDVRASADVAAVHIAVEDRGPGFTAAELPRIFEPFFTKRRGGTGLGLSLVQRIVEEHGGSVVASNRTGGGASMVVTLPIERGATP